MSLNFKCIISVYTCGLSLNQYKPSTLGPRAQERCHVLESEAILCQNGHVRRLDIPRIVRAASTCGLRKTHLSLLIVFFAS